MTIIAMRSQGICEGKAQDETRYDLLSLRTGPSPTQNHPAALVHHYWHWVRYMAPREYAHHYREFNSVQIMATLSNLTINALRVDGIWSITEGIASLAHDIEGMLRLLGWKAPVSIPPTG